MCVPCFIHYISLIKWKLHVNREFLFVYLFCSDVLPIPRPVLGSQAVASGDLE